MTGDEVLAKRDRTAERLVREYRPHNVWEGIDLSHEWAVISRTIGESDDELLWIFTVDRETLDAIERTGQHDGRAVVALVHLDHTIRLLPTLSWDQPKCTWPGCRLFNGGPDLVALGAMRYGGGYLCTTHEAEAKDLQAEAVDR